MRKKPPDPGGLWRLVPYVSPNFRCQVHEWIEDDLRLARPAAYVEFYDDKKGLAQKLQRHGPAALERTPAWKRYGDGLYALRWERGCRIYCSVESNKRIVMYHGCIKTWREFIHRSVCNQRRKDFLSSEYDQQVRELRYLALRKRRGQNGIA